MSDAKNRKKTNKIKGTPAIILAADEGDVEKVAELIAADPTCVTQTNRSGWTALHQAAHAGEEFVIEELLEAKADINAVCFTFRNNRII
jgi:ankyrin repeat protein